MTPEAQLELVKTIVPALTLIVTIVTTLLTLSNNKKLVAQQEQLTSTQASIADTHVQSLATADKLDAVGTQIDGKMAELVKFTSQLGNAAGRVEGTAIERDRVAVETAAKNAAIVAQIQGTINGGHEPPVAISGGPDPKPLNTDEPLT